MHIGAGIHEQIRAEHAGDGAARANHRHLGGRVSTGLDQRCGGAATKVDQQIPEAAQQILDIVPENPQEQHVAAEMQPSAMQELAGEDRRPGRQHREPWRQRRMPKQHRRDHAVLECDDIRVVRQLP